MTAYSMTMSAAIVAFGAAPTDKWNAYLWNAFKWGEGTDTIGRSIRQQVNPAALTITPAAAANWRFIGQVVGGTLTPADAINFRFRIGTSDTITPTNSLEHAYVQDPNNYFRVFPEGQTDLTLRSVPTWSRPASGAVSWSTAAPNTTVWS